MKKIFIALLIAMLIFTTIGCAKDSGEDTSAETNTQESADAPETGGVEAAATAYFADFTENPVIKWPDLFTMIDAGDEPFILSIRQQDVYDEGHIMGAYLASWGADLAEKVTMIPTDVPVYVYCYSGQTAGQTVALMRMLGIDAYSVQSGYNYGAMKTEGFEAYVETTANELPDAGASFDADVLAFVQDYFNQVADNGNFQIASADAKPLIDAGEVTFVDVRQPDAFDAAHVDGAINIPFGQGMDFSALPMDQQLVVACYTGQTAGQTTAVLRALGYDAWSLKFGIEGAAGWVNYIKTTAANNYFADYPGSRIISWEDLFTKMDAEEDLFILSIRQQDVYDEGHIKGAYLASWGADLAEKVAMLPTDQTVYVYCYSGQTAGQTVALLNMLGIEAISVKSGFNNGATAIDGYEAYVETTASELPDAGASFEPFMLREVKAYFNAVADNANFKISLEDALAAVEAGDVSVIDIRTAEDFATGHIEGAINIPFGENMQESFSDLPEGKIIVACYSGQTAGQTTAVLRMLGHDAVSMHLGMKLGWIAEGYPVVTD